MTARAAAEISAVDRNTAILFYHKLREVIFDALAAEAPELFVDQRNHINGIENFWNQAKRRLRSSNGIPRQHFHLFIKKCEWRFNYRPIGRMQETLMGWWFK